MSLSSNVTILWDALDEWTPSESVATIDNISSLTTPQRTDLCTLTPTIGYSPAITATCPTTTSYDAVAFVDFGMAVSGCYGTAAAYIDSVEYDLGYLGAYRTIGSTGLWSNVGWARDPTIIFDNSGSVSPSSITPAKKIAFYAGGLTSSYSMTLGRLMFARKWSPTYNFNFGWQASIIDNSQSVKSIGGQSWTAKKSRQWQITFDLSAMATEEAVGELAAIAWKLGTHTDFVLALTPNADEADIFTLYGRFTELPIFQNSHYGLYDTQLIFTESL